MRIAIIGAGAIGGTIAALLSRGGHEVTLTARGEHLAAIRNGGLRLSGAWGAFTANVEADATIGHPPELAFVTTKAQDAEAAMRANVDSLDGAPTVIVQNGLHAIDTAQRVLPHSDIVGAIALYAASYLSPGEVKVTTSGPTYLGSAPGTTKSPTPDLATLHASRVLGGVMPVNTTSNFAGAQWTKLVVNQINALPAITGLSAQDVIADRALRGIMVRSMREAVQVGIADGVRFASIQGLSNPLLRLFARLPESIGQVLPLAMKRRMGATPNPGSTLQSIRRGQASEIDYLNGAIVEAGARLGIPTPINLALVQLVHEVEHGTFVPPRDVVAGVPDS